MAKKKEEVIEEVDVVEKEVNDVQEDKTDVKSDKETKPKAKRTTKADSSNDDDITIVTTKSFAGTETWDSKTKRTIFTPHK